MKKIKIITITLIILSSVVLRFINIDWGVPLSTAHFPYHPDEQMSMSILDQINVKTGDFVPEEAHVEGSFNYYIWKIYLLALSKIHILNFSTNQIPFTASNNYYGQALLASRILTATFSSMSVIVMLIILNLLNIPFIPKVISLLLYGTNLIEVVHGHFMRPHTFANLLLLLVIYFTFKKKYSSEIYRFILAGIFSGLTLATRYNSIAIIIPIVYVFMEFFKKKKWTFLFYGWIVTAIFFIIGFFIGDPAIFTNFKQVEPFLRYQSTFIAKNQFTIRGILDLSRIKTYITYLIPFANFPTSWIIIYVSTLTAPLLNKSRKVIIPLLSFILIYLFLMAKGYSEAIYVRATLPMIPPLAIITAIFLKTIWKYHKLRLTITIACSLLLIPSIFFTTLYVVGMNSKNDPRDKMSNFINNIYSKKPITLFFPKNWLCSYYIQGSLYATASRYEFVDTSTYISKPNSYYVLCEFNPYPVNVISEVKTSKINEIISFTNEVPLLKSFNLNNYLPSDLMYPYLTLKVYKN